MITLYHGTNAINLNEVLDSPKATKNINGLAFYLSREYDTASRYGNRVVAWEVDEAMVTFIERPIDQSYVDGISSYETCVLGGMEVVMSQVEVNTLAYICEDAYKMDKLGNRI